MRGALRVVALGAGGLACCAVLAYALLLLINARDEMPSPQAIALQRVQAQRATVADKDNAFVYLLGITAGEGASPLHVGSLQRAAMEKGSYIPPETQELARLRYADARPPEVRKLASACGNDYVECAGALDAGASTQVRQWLSDEAWLLARYRELISLPGWYETIPRNGLLPRYQDIMNGQQLLLMQAWLAARQGDTSSVNQLLEQDLRFWRMVLRDADTLISKMIATAAMNRNFAVGNLVLRELGPSQARAVPAQWRIPLAEEERAMTRAGGRAAIRSLRNREVAGAAGRFRIDG